MRKEFSGLTQDASTYFRQYCNKHSTTQCFRISCPISFFRLRQINSFDAEMNKISVQIVGSSSEDKHYFPAKMYLNLKTWKYILTEFGVCIRLFGSRCRVFILDFPVLDYWNWHSVHCTALILVCCYECTYPWIIINKNICVQRKFYKNWSVIREGWDIRICTKKEYKQCDIFVQYGPF